jgi:hypothetical protein
MSRSFAIGGALLALAAFIPSADAAMLGCINPSASLSRGDARIPMTSSIGSVRTFSPDGHSFSPDGHGKDHWKKPLDSDQGGDQDPPKQTTDSSGGGGGSIYYHPHYWHPRSISATAASRRSPAAAGPVAADPAASNPSRRAPAPQGAGEAHCCTALAHLSHPAGFAIRPACR